jgi:hypothetical protein
MAAKLAAWLVYMMGVLMAGVLALHFLALLVWQALRWTRQYPLPYFLVYPVPEVLLANVLVLPLAMASAALLVLPAGAHARALGAAGMLALLAYLVLVAAVLLALARRQKQLGLSYIKLGRSAAAAGDRVGQSASCWPQRASKASVLNSKSPFQAPASKDADKLALAARMLLQFSPPHSHGYWERADVALQQELRRCYQRERDFGCLSGARMPCSGDTTSEPAMHCRLLSSTDATSSPAGCFALAPHRPTPGRLAAPQALENTQDTFNPGAEQGPGMLHCAARTTTAGA